MAEYIEREATKDAICRLCRDTRNKDCELSGDCHMMPRIDNLPAADVAPVVRGRWIEAKTGFHCSACKCKAKGTSKGALLSRFCHTCGARMEET